MHCGSSLVILLRNCLEGLEELEQWFNNPALNFDKCCFPGEAEILLMSLAYRYVGHIVAYFLYCIVPLYCLSYNLRQQRVLVFRGVSQRRLIGFVINTVTCFVGSEG